MNKTADSYTKSVRFTEETNERFSSLAGKLGRDKRVIFRQMVEYFYRTKKDPQDINDDLLKNTLVKNHDTYIRFIRAQEEMILIPVKTEVDRMVASQIRIIDSFNSQVLKANRDILTGQEKQAAAMNSLLKTLTDKLDSKESLKTKFLYILNYYSKAVQNATPKERESLLQETKTHISKL
jgi:hypothetical protein